MTATKQSQMEWDPRIVSSLQPREESTRGPGSAVLSRKPSPNATRRCKSRRGPPLRQEASLEPPVGRAEQERIKGSAAGRGSLPERGALLWILMFSRFMAATGHLHAGAAAGAARDGREHKAPRLARPRLPSRGAGRRPMAESSGPVPAPSLGAGRG